VDGFGVGDGDDGHGGRGGLRGKNDKGKGRKAGGGVGGGLIGTTQRRVTLQEGSSTSPGSQAGSSRSEAIQRDISYLSAAIHIPHHVGISIGGHAPFTTHARIWGHDARYRGRRRGSREGGAGSAFDCVSRRRAQGGEKAVQAGGREGVSEGEWCLH